MYLQHGCSIIPDFWFKKKTSAFFSVVWHIRCPWTLSKHKSNETPAWWNTVQVLFLQSHSTCFGRKRPSSGVFKTSTAATGTCVNVVGQSSHLFIRAGTALIKKHVEWLCRNKTCTVLHQVDVWFDLYYVARKHKIKILSKHVGLMSSLL